MMHIQILLNTGQFERALNEAEKYIYLAAHRHTGGNQSATAKVLGVSRTTLITKLRQWENPQTD